MKAIFYTYNGESLKISKTLSNGFESEITLKSESYYDLKNLMSLVLVLPKDFSKYNYVYIEDFERYYFITQKEFTRTTYIRVTLNEDVLKTFEDDILKTKARIIKSENPTDSTINRTMTDKEDILAYTYNDLADENGSNILITSVTQ